MKPPKLLNCDEIGAIDPGTMQMPELLTYDAIVAIDPGTRTMGAAWISMDGEAIKHAQSEIPKSDPWSLWGRVYPFVFDAFCGRKTLVIIESFQVRIAHTASAETLRTIGIIEGTLLNEMQFVGRVELVTHAQWRAAYREYAMLQIARDFVPMDQKMNLREHEKDAVQMVLAARYGGMFASESKKKDE